MFSRSGTGCSVEITVVLLKTFPQDSWEESDPTALTFTRPLNASDWSRFHFYSGCVKNFHQWDCGFDATVIFRALDHSSDKIFHVHYYPTYVI
ncbi:hypothetical protein PILCRDRAFT_580986 [Piloderma croceum F 1598]|uniref:Uncharacterized protein n=1 Tax=Piloderma croceum (strain F 1598) TaxID=765440 RepID=A0A0C3F2B2_PILCF|nr:hypothetical protein PILCRDRAFT_580986 [Piloderma croceum F 1598]